MKYQSHRDHSPSELIPAEPAHIVVGQTLYLGDPRKTPVIVTSQEPETASFSVKVVDFEDVGAIWVFPVWEVSKFLVKKSAVTLCEQDLESLVVNIQALNQQVRIECNPAQRDQTLTDISAAKAEVEELLSGGHFNLDCDAEALTGSTRVSTSWSHALESLMRAEDLFELEMDFVTAFASNPNAGEIVKGHRLVLAEMGLCRYTGPMLRDVTFLQAGWSAMRRRRHILLRMAFMQAMFDRLGLAEVPLFRTIYSNQGLSAPRNTGFVSTTFNREVALALFEAAQQCRVASLLSQRVPANRVFMTYFETPALSAKYQEAEAVLLFDPDNPVF